jgi:hypothetical protein
VSCCLARIVEGLKLKIPLPRRMTAVHDIYAAPRSSTAPKAYDLVLIEAVPGVRRGTIIANNMTQKANKNEKG